MYQETARPQTFFASSFLSFVIISWCSILPVCSLEFVRLSTVYAKRVGIYQKKERN